MGLTRTFNRLTGGAYGQAKQAVGDVAGGVENVFQAAGNRIDAFMENPWPVIQTAALTYALGPSGAGYSDATAAMMSQAAVKAANGGNMQDIALSVATAYAGAKIGTEIGGYAQTIDPDLSNTLKQVIASSSGSAAVTALRGGSLENILQSGVSGAVNGYVASALKEQGYTNVDQKLISNAASAATNAILNGKSISDAVGQSVASTALTAALQGNIGQINKNNELVNGLSKQLDSLKSDAERFLQTNVSAPSRYVDGWAQEVNKSIDQYKSLQPLALESEAAFKDLYAQYQANPNDEQLTLQTSDALKKFQADSAALQNSYNNYLTANYSMNNPKFGLPELERQQQQLDRYYISPLNELSNQITAINEENSTLAAQVGEQVAQYKDLSLQDSSGLVKQIGDEAIADLMAAYKVAENAATADTGTQVASSDSSNLPTTPSWVRVPPNGTLDGIRRSEDGEATVATVTATNPNNPTDKFTYDVVRDNVDNTVTYETGELKFDEDGNVIGGGSTVSSKTEPVLPWELPEGAGSSAPLNVDPIEAIIPPDVLEQEKTPTGALPSTNVPQAPSQPIAGGLPSEIAPEVPSQPTTGGLPSIDLPEIPSQPTTSGLPSVVDVAPPEVTSNLPTTGVVTEAPPTRVEPINTGLGGTGGVLGSTEGVGGIGGVAGGTTEAPSAPVLPPEEPITPPATPAPTVPTTPVIKPVITPVAPTTTTAPVATQTSAPLSPLDLTPKFLDTNPRFLETKVVSGSQPKMQELRQLYESMTPELASTMADRGYDAPQYMAGGGTADSSYDINNFADSLNPSSKNLGFVKPYASNLLPAAPLMQNQMKLNPLRHLHESLISRQKTAGGLANGGLPQKYAEALPAGHKPEFITGLTGYYASGKGTGQSDDIDAMLHDGDYVADADLVAALGDGSSKAGAEALEKFRRQIPHQEHAQGGAAVAAKIADGEYVFPASFVTAIGQGDNKAGAKILDKMRESIRAHKRSAPTTKIPPKAKSPLDYLKMVKG